MGRFALNTLTKYGAFAIFMMMALHLLIHCQYPYSSLLTNNPHDPHEFCVLNTSESATNSVLYNMVQYSDFITNHIIPILFAYYHQYTFYTIIILSSTPVIATVFEHQYELLASDGATGDEFGYSVSIHSKYALICARRDDDLGLKSGSAYIFERINDEWIQTQKVNANDSREDDEFGFAVSIYNEIALIGAWGDTDYGQDSGSAYIFEKDADNWIQTAKLTPSDLTDHDRFGCSVSIYEDYALIGALSSPHVAPGSAYIYQKIANEWLQITKLSPIVPDGSSGKFGESVSIYKTYAIIGASWDNINGTEKSGSAYIFERIDSVWNETAKLVASDGAAYDYFGRSVAISDTYAAVGAYGVDYSGGYYSNGAVYIFQKINGTWTEMTKLRGHKGDMYFGFAVSINQEYIKDYIVVGAYIADTVYVFQEIKDEWIEIVKVKPGNDSGNGYSVSIYHNDILSGAKLINNQTGAAYIWELVWSFECDNANQCKNGDYQCHEYMDCDILCRSDYACYNATFQCPIYGNCSIQIEDGHQVSKYMAIHAENTSYLLINISLTAEKDALRNSSILCPLYGECIINVETSDPTFDPTSDPTTDPSTVPTLIPTTDPTADPTRDPTSVPTIDPTVDPTLHPTANPTHNPAADATPHPTADPTIEPTAYPTSHPTKHPAMSPTVAPSLAPSGAPTACTDYNQYMSLDGTNETMYEKHSPVYTKYQNHTFPANIIVQSISSIDYDEYLVDVDIECNINGTDADVCIVECYSIAHCTSANIKPIPFSMQQLTVICADRYSCIEMTINITQIMVDTVSILCTGKTSCKMLDITINAISDIQLIIECDESYSCQHMTINVSHLDPQDTIYVNVTCYNDYACNNLHIVTDDSANIFINLAALKYSQDIEISYHYWQNIAVQCGLHSERRYIRYDTDVLLDEFEVLQRARYEYDSTYRLPCEDIHILCSNNTDFVRECTFKYAFNDEFSLIDILKDKNRPNCYWLKLGELYEAKCRGTCGDNMVYQEYPQSFSLDLEFLFEDDTNPASNATTESYQMCAKYFGSIMGTQDSLHSIDIIFYNVLKMMTIDGSVIHDIVIPPQTVLRDNVSAVQCKNEKKNIIKMEANVTISSAVNDEKIINAIFAHNGEFLNQSQILLSQFFGFPISFAYLSNRINQGISIKIYIVSIGSAFCVIICIITTVIIFRNKRKAKYAALTTYISNPMVISIGIARYEDDPFKPMVDGYFRNLDGIDTDIKNVNALFGDKLKHTVYPKEMKLQWTLTEIMQFLEEKANELEANVDSVYDGLVAILSCHGITDYIVTSDYKKIKKSAIHRIFSTEKPTLRSIPRLFLFDCCDGEEYNDKTLLRDEIHETHYGGEAEMNTIQNKGTDTKSVKLKDSNTLSVNQTEEQFSRSYSKNVELSSISGADGSWLRNEKNPDYKLVTIHASNEGFQSRLNTVKGSYAITAFTQKLSENIENDNKKWLFQICDDIQLELHSRGIQHTVNTFNDNMRYLKFQKNDRVVIDDEKENMNNEVQLTKTQTSPLQK